MSGVFTLITGIQEGILMVNENISNTAKKQYHEYLLKKYMSQATDLPIQLLSNKYVKNSNYPSPNK